MKSVMIVLSVIFLIFPLYPQQHKEIVEKVAVDWWVIPIFAVDSSGKSVQDLNISDIELRIDKQKVENFTLLKKSYAVSVPGQEAGPQAQEEQPVGTPAAVERAKNVFLLFDIVLTTKESTEKAKAVARKMVMDAEKNTRFFVMTIEPFIGLVYAGGGTNDKNLITDIITNRVLAKDNVRVPASGEVIASTEGKSGKYDEAELDFFAAEASKYHVRRSMSFVQSFESLYYAINSVTDNKFVYLFSEGVSVALRMADSGNVALYRAYFKKMADYLGRSGAVLFIINTSGTISPTVAERSGEDSLEFLARESGGKYLEGSENDVLGKIENIHNAYYEIFFPAVPKSKQGILKISVISKRKGIDIHTLKTTEKFRTYPEMKPLEQEVLVLNLVSGNPLYKGGLSLQKMEIGEISKKKGRVTYRLNIPDRFFNRPLDLYKVWLDKSGKGTKVEKESLRSAPRGMKVTFKKVEEGEETYFVLVDSQHETALVHGVKTPEAAEGQTYDFRMPADTETEEWATREIMEGMQKTGKKGEDAELERLLKGAANYCENLKKAAFHYICKEKIVETQTPLSRRANPGREIATTEPQDLFERAVVLDRQSPGQITRTKVEKHTFNYRLIKLGEQVKEERDLVSDEKEAKDERKEKGGRDLNEILRDIRFLSSKAVFGPITMLAADRQDSYHYRLLGRKDIMGRPAAVIEALPKDEKDSLFVYGKIWLDTENFSIIKIKANPNSILGYNRLEKLAKELNTKLLLDLETEFFNYREGIRFPTAIRFLETYKGGPFITSQRGSQGWKRTETHTTYTGYAFFSVDMDVIYNKE
jgi:hypothetical protein